ncbi:hypothetical protein [Halobacillus trueperi]|uniref:hypothetical protein n=1 Tax=Halobacillus trueperi TaxID=156205 RepID=UPI003735B168
MILGSFVVLVGVVFSWILSLLLFILTMVAYLMISLLVGLIRPSVIRTVGRRTRKNIVVQYTGILVILMIAFFSVIFVGMSLDEGDEEIVLGEYVGDRVEGLKSGEGKLFNNSSYYEGEWLHNKRNGFGKGVVDLGWLAYFEYEGQWKDDREHGEGKGVVDVLWMHTVYEGEWKNGKREGYGEFIDRSGNTYRGEWVNDSPEGEGEMVLTSGEIYLGEVSGFQRHGYGKAVLENGDVKEGEWREGEFLE